MGKESRTYNTHFQRVITWLKVIDRRKQWVVSTEYLKLTDTQQTETESNEHGEVHDTDLGVQVGWSGYI